MEVKTKFNMGDVVYFNSYEGIKKGIIEGFIYTSSEEIHYTVDAKNKIGVRDHVREDECYKSMTELKESIIVKLKDEINEIIYREQQLPYDVDHLKSVINQLSALGVETKLSAIFIQNNKKENKDGMV